MTFYFYDLETSGFRGRRDRIMQFAGQRTDLELRPIGKPDNILIKLTEDILPEPDAVLVHGISPQTTRSDGITEADFAKYFANQIVKPDTIFVGYNNIRFDDEFMRFLLWRNFYDAYEWQWKDGCSKWDLLDLTRMTRALRPQGIKWPFDSEGRPSNRLELLASINKLNHDSAHDALSDVSASIALARLIRNKQTKLFDYLLMMRKKSNVQALVEKADPFVYSSGRYPSQFEKTSVAVLVSPTVEGRGALVYDLRVDPTPFLSLSAAELVTKWQDRSDAADYFPVKQLSYNRCAAVAPLTTLDKTSQKRLQLDMSRVQENQKKLRADKNFAEKLLAAQEIMYPRNQPEMVMDPDAVDELLYEGFVSDADKVKMSAVRAADQSTIGSLMLDFADERLKYLLPLYKARNFPKVLTTEERAAWENFRYKKLLEGDEQSPAAKFFKRLEELAAQPRLSKQHKHLLEELQLYGQMVVPLPDELAGTG